MTFANSKYVRCCRTVKNDIKIIGSEDGLISLVKVHEIIQNEDDDLNEKDIFMEEEKNEEDLNKKVFFRNFIYLFIHKNRKSSKTTITSSTLSGND